MRSVCVPVPLREREREREADRKEKGKVSGITSSSYTSLQTWQSSVMYVCWTLSLMYNAFHNKMIGSAIDFGCGIIRYYSCILPLLLYIVVIVVRMFDIWMRTITINSCDDFLRQSSISFCEIYAPSAATATVPPIHINTSPKHIVCVSVSLDQ